MSHANPLITLKSHGQSIWLDFIQRSLLDSGELERLISEDGICGLTSNPAIFEKAIAATSEYDRSLLTALAGDPELSAEDLFEALAVDDIARAADLFHHVHQNSRGDDGMVSLEVSPELAHDADETVKEALRLWHHLDRPNVMIKVPGTLAGVEAFERLTAKGVSVNVTLLFSVERYRAVVQAYLRGLEKRTEKHEPLEGIASVASFFVSRVDLAVDAALEANGSDAALALRGQTAIANAKLAYGHWQNIFNSDKFQRFRDAGALPQRLLWASTGVKNPAYSDVMYIDELLGAETVNTVPPATLDAYRDHGLPAERLSKGLTEAQAMIEQLPSYGVDLAAITDKLESDGVAQFSEAFQRLLAAISDKCNTLDKD
jgi:transaldolase